jgi:two-component system, sensor histidine kinase and response regulator
MRLKRPRLAPILEHGKVITTPRRDAVLRQTDDESTPIKSLRTSLFSRLKSSLHSWTAPQSIARESREQLLHSLNSMIGGSGVRVWEWDIVARRLHLSELYGYDIDVNADPTEALLQALHPDDRKHFQAQLMQALKGEVPLLIRHRIVHKDGSIHPKELRGEIIRNDEGQALRVIGITIDVGDKVDTALRIAEQDERQNHILRRLKLATDSANISIWEQDVASGEFEDDGSFFKLFGLQPTRKFKPGDGIHPDERRATLKPVYDAVMDPHSNDIISIRHRTCNPRPEPQYVQTHIRIYRDGKGEALRLLGCTWDVTRETLHATELEKQAAKERALIERLNITTTAAGISAWEFDLIADRFSWHGLRPVHFGLDQVPLEHYWTALLDKIVPEDRERMLAISDDAIANNLDAYQYIFRVVGTDGEIHHLQNYAKIMRDADGIARHIVGVTWDITKDIVANQLLKSQAEENRSLATLLNMATESADIGTWDIDLSAGRYTSVTNPIKALGLKEQDYGDLMEFADRILKDDREVMVEQIQQAMRQGLDRIRFRYRARGVEGNIVHVQNAGRVFFDETRRPTRIVGLSWDITDEVLASEFLRQQSEQLRSAERRLERASLSSFEGHWEADLSNGYLWYSSSFRTLLGYPDGELPMHVDTLDYLIHVEDHETYRTSLASHLSVNSAFDIETRLRMASGDSRWFRLRGMAERDAQGAALVIAGSIQDIHQQKLVEDALGATQRRFERAINGTQDGLWELDVDSDTNWSSPRLAQLLGYAPEQLGTGNNFLRALTHPEDIEKLDEAIRAHYRSNSPFDVEVRLRTASSEYRWYRARATAERTVEGLAQRLSGSLQDVTEARAAREELVKATEAAQAASLAKSHFLANVSHEIRTPMNGIIGMTGLLQDTALDRTQRDYAETIRSSADSLLTVINDILDFSKIEAGKLDLESIELDVRVNVEEVGAMMAFQAASKGLELIVSVHPEIPDRVLGDPQRLRQCLINLVSNAVKFTQRGEIVIEVRPESTGGRIVQTRFEVRDTGMGIAPQTLSTLFHPFVQADSSTTRHFGGTGLGLSIVRRLVELMGGEVGVVSELDVGSRFFFTLPLTPVEATVPSLPVHNPLAGRILVVDDNATNQKVLASLLTHVGYEVDCAASAAIALTKLDQACEANRAFHMVITDYMMPDMDGAMLGERIINSPTLADTRLVMLTSLDRHGDTPRLAALGFAAYLTKPVRTRELLYAVAKVMSGEPRQWQMDTQPMITRSTLTQDTAKQRFRGHVLLVEDNVVNQKVAMRFLERLGCSVDVANNGAEGVEAATSKIYNIVLMDLQMPVMDGLTATRKIRESETNGEHMPIIALTANAMSGDRERCEAAGMDGYLTKPIEVERLRGVLAKFGLAMADKTTVVPETPPAASPSVQRPPVDLRAFNDIVAEDHEFAQELIATFIQSGEQQLEEIASMIANGNRDGLARSAHKLKGACANIHAHILQTFAHRLETDSKSAEQSALELGNHRLRQEFERTKQFLTDPAVVPPLSKAVS